MGHTVSPLSYRSALCVGEIRCDGPNTNLYKFEGVVEWREEKVSLNNDMLLLRGCIVRNTEWCYGAVIYAGVDTKLMMNCGTKSFKRTNVELLMNRIIIGVRANACWCGCRVYCYVMTHMTRSRRRPGSLQKSRYINYIHK